MMSNLRAIYRRYMLTFYGILLWLVRYEIVIARSTGRNQMNVLALRQDEDEYQRAMLRLELNL